MDSNHVEVVTIQIPDHPSSVQSVQTPKSCAGLCGCEAGHTSKGAQGQSRAFERLPFARPAYTVLLHTQCLHPPNSSRGGITVAISQMGMLRLRKFVQGHREPTSDCLRSHAVFLTLKLRAEKKASKMVDPEKSRDTKAP